SYHPCRLEQLLLTEDHDSIDRNHLAQRFSYRLPPAAHFFHVIQTSIGDHGNMSLDQPLTDQLVFWFECHALENCSVNVIARSQIQEPCLLLYSRGTHPLPWHIGAVHADD